MKNKLIIISTVFLFSCGAQHQYEFFNNGSCNITGIKDYSKDVWIRNTSSSEIITFTIQTTVTENGEVSTRILEIPPGDIREVGCESDLQGTKTYKVVGAYYGKRK